MTDRATLVLRKDDFRRQRLRSPRLAYDAGVEGDTHEDQR
jgi:hypothetical protein